MQYLDSLKECHSSELAIVRLLYFSHPNRCFLLFFSNANAEWKRFDWTNGSFFDSAVDVNLLVYNEVLGIL